MTDAQLVEHLHARGYRIEITDVPMIREACAALIADRDSWHQQASEDAERYRHVRRLSPRAFTEIHMRNIEGEGLFDDLIDQDMEMRAEAIRGRLGEEAG